MLQAAILSGILETALWDPAVPFDSRNFRDMGNVTALNYQYDVEQRRLPNARTGRGTYASADRVNEVTGGFDARNFNPDNLALALWATTTVGATTAIVDEPHVFHGAGSFVMTAKLINTTVAPVVKVGSTTVPTSDYVAERAGIRFNPTVATAELVAEEDITISYTPSAIVDIEALVTTAPLVSMRLIGEDAVSGQPVTARFHKAKLGLNGQVDMIGDDFISVPISFTLEEDESVIGSGLSKYFKLQQLGAAA